MADPAAPAPAAPVPLYSNPEDAAKLQKCVRCIERLAGKQFEQIDPESFPRIIL